MKFTKEDAYKDLVSKMTARGEKLDLSERSINEQLDTLMPMVANDETELSDFVEKTLPLFKTANANIRNDVSVGINKYKTEHPITDQKPTASPTEDKEGSKSEFEKRIEALELGKTTPRQNAEQLQMFAEHHDVSDSHIIYDAIRGTYINDYIPDAIPFFSYAHPMGVYGRMARQLKDECYMRLIEMIKRGDLSISEKVGTRIYEHQKLKENITIQNEFIEECAVVRFKEVQNGKKTLLSKREMNQKLGKGRSMDLLDPCAMRMLPVLHLPYGDERIGSAIDEDDEDEETDVWGQPNSIYEDSTWC